MIFDAWLGIKRCPEGKNIINKLLYAFKSVEIVWSNLFLVCQDQLVQIPHDFEVIACITLHFSL